MEALKIPLADCKRITGESAAVIYDAIRAGHLATFLVGRRRFVRPQALRDWVDFLEAESIAGRPVVYRARRDRNVPAEVEMQSSTKSQRCGGVR